MVSNQDSSAGKGGCFLNFDVVKRSSFSTVTALNILNHYYQDFTRKVANLRSF